jgi:hypothetical protein
LVRAQLPNLAEQDHVVLDARDNTVDYFLPGQMAAGAREQHTDHYYSREIPWH